jgi:hypothetical protein
MATVSPAPAPMYLSQPYGQVEELPVYTRRSARRASVHPTVSRSSPPQERAQHSYELGNKGRPWAKLCMESSARSSEQMPMFYEDEPIAGSLVLSLEKEDSITAISITVSMIHLLVINCS